MASVDLQEKANFTRLSRLLVDKGTEALRNTFDTIHPPASLPAVLAANRTSLLRLKPRVINNAQWDLLYPPSGNPPDSKTFDVTLLTVLFRNICGLPSTGWGVMPLDTDRSMQANIVRIKSLRNEVYAHVTSTQVDNATFESLWQKISHALVELNIPQKDVDDLKTCPLALEEDVYVKTLKDWKLQEDECIKMLEAIECSIDRLTRITDENHDGIKQLRHNFEKNCSKESDEDLLRKLAKHNFNCKVRNKVKFFLPGTREWLLKEVDEWFVKNEHDSRMLLLTAGPGFGKSVFAAKVCEDFKKNANLAACHFCDFSNSNLRDPMMMLQSLASQMCENIVGFKEKLLDQLKRPSQVQSLKDAFRIYLQNPLDELELDEPSLVVIDGLDESAADDKNEIMNLIADYFPDLPENIKVLVTSRPEISVRKLSGVQTINIANNDTMNNLDLELYFRSCLPSLADREIDMNGLMVSDVDLYIPGAYPLDDEIISVLSVVVKKCEGSFLYAYYIQSELQTRDDLQKMTFDEILKFLPEGLDSIYQTYFKRLEDELKALKHENVDVLKILEMISASKGPLPLTFVAQALGLAPDCRETKDIINKINETVSCLLYVSDDLLTVFHKSVIDWLLARGYKDHEYTVKVGDGNRSLWLICEKVFEEIVKRVCSGHDLNLTNYVKYALDHGLIHLVECKMEESFFWLVDVVIIHVLLTIYPKKGTESTFLFLWNRIVQSTLVISDKLRTQISWHLYIFDFIYCYPRSFSRRYYLQTVLTDSPKSYFSDDEKKIASKLLSSMVPPFVELKFYEVEVMPRSFWNVPSQGLGRVITAVAVSYDNTMLAVGWGSEMISVISIPSLVEMWEYSTKRTSCCTFAPDDSFVLFGKLETALNIAERREVPFFHGNEETFTSCAFSPKGKRLVTSNGSSSTIKLWDVAKQMLLSSLCAEVPVNWCSFSNTGLFIIGDFKPAIIAEDSSIIYTGFRAEDSFCVWNAITWQRSDKRNSPNAKLKEPGVFKSKKCERCFRPGVEEINSCKRLEIEPGLSSKLSGKQWKAWSTGTYNGVECIFGWDEQTLSVIESTHFTMLAAWNFVTIPARFFKSFTPCKITPIEDDLWLYSDEEKLFVFRTLAPTQEQSSCLSLPAEVYSSSFSPDGSRLATCTSDGYINIWNVYTSQVEQRFQINQSGSSFACWWSEKFLFVFDFFDRIPSLSIYPVDVNLKILFTQSQQVSLCHLVNEFVPLSAVVDFSEGFLIFVCGETEPVKVLDVNGVGGPRMVTLPGIARWMSVGVSPGASFVSGVDIDSCYIWKRNAEEPAVYEVFCREQYMKRGLDFICCFSNDSKVAIVLQERRRLGSKIIDLDTGNSQFVWFESLTSRPKLYCINKDRVVIAATRHCIQFFDMYSGALIESSIQRYLTEDLLLQTKLSPKETVLAFPNMKGDMVFLRLFIPPNPLLSNIEREEAIEWRNILKRYNHLIAIRRLMHHIKTFP